MSEPYWVPIGGGGGLAGIGTTLPASPSDGDEYVLVDSLTLPTYAWRFKYVAGITDAYKWVCVGASPIVAAVESLAGETTAAAAYGDLATVGPSIVIPRTGLYVIAGGAHITVSANGLVGRAALKRGAAATSDNDLVQQKQGIVAADANANPFMGSRTFPAALCTAGDTYKLQYALAAGAGSASFTRRWLSLQPVRV